MDAKLPVGPRENMEGGKKNLNDSAREEKGQTMRSFSGMQFK